jgi:hypothetical protein
LRGEGLEAWLRWYYQKTKKKKVVNKGLNCPLKNKLAGHQWLTPVNPSYSGGRDQEDHSSKPVQANSFTRPISKNPSQR